MTVNPGTTPSVSQNDDSKKMARRARLEAAFVAVVVTLLAASYVDGIAWATADVIDAALPSVSVDSEVASAAFYFALAVLVYRLGREDWRRVAVASAIGIAAAAITAHLGLLLWLVQVSHPWPTVFDILQSTMGYLVAYYAYGAHVGQLATKRQVAFAATVAVVAGLLAYGTFDLLDIGRALSARSFIPIVVAERVFTTALWMCTGLIALYRLTPPARFPGEVGA